MWRDRLTPVFRDRGQRFGHPFPLSKGPRSWDSKVADNRAQRLCFEAIPWERGLAGHGDGGGGIRTSLLRSTPAVSFPFLAQNFGHSALGIPCCSAVSVACYLSRINCYRYWKMIYLQG